MKTFNFEQTAKNCFYFMFSASFCWLVINILFFNVYFDYNSLLSLLIAAVWFVFFTFIFKMVNSYIVWIENNMYFFLALMIVIITATQILVWNFCAGYPTRDFERVFTGAYNYTITGEILDPYLDYFYKYPNNMPLTIVYQFIFRAVYRVFGTGINFFILGAVFNGVCITCAYVFMFLAVRNLSGIKNAVMSVLILYFCLPLQTYISIFYTDTTTMFYPPMMLYYYSRIESRVDIKKYFPDILLVGCAVAFGIKIKYSVAIMLIAVLIALAIKFDVKKIILLITTITFAYSMVSVVIDGFMYKNILNKEKASDRSTPFIAWIAMGLGGEGVHNPNDNHYIWSFETKEEKTQAAKEQLWTRLEEMGPTGYLKFLNRKMVRSFGSGNLDYINTVSDSPMKQNVAIDILNKDGKYNYIFDNIIQGYHVLVFIFIALSGIMGLKNKNRVFFTRQLASMGMLLFLLLWEAGTRYLLNYYPVFIMCALPALIQVIENIFNKKESKIALDNRL